VLEAAIGPVSFELPEMMRASIRGKKKFVPKDPVHSPTL
jgi:hypothetical protein